MTFSVPDYLTEGLNPSQREAVCYLSGPLLVVAGPGSGKTKVLTHRVAALVASGIDPRKVAAVTFTNRAANEMRDRLDVLLGSEVSRQLTVNTFHAMCSRMLRRFYLEAGLPQRFTIADSKDSAALLTAAATDAGLLEHLDQDARKELLRTSKRLISSAKNAGISDPALWHAPPGAADVPAVWVQYEKLLRASGTVDFDDLLVKVAQLGAHPTVGPALRSRFSRFLVDEYQDTNAVQHQLITLFAGPDSQVCAVGDPDQSVYAFRGATGSVADVFTARWPDAHVVVLAKNYRSSGNICAVSSAVIAPNPAKHRAVLHTDGEAGSKVVLLHASDPEAEALWAAEKLNTLVATSPPTFSAAVLVRANHQTRPLEKALTVAGVRHALLGTLRFADRAEVKDVLAWLRLASNPHDISAMVRASTTPRRGVGATTVGLLRAQMLEGADVVQACFTVAEMSSRAAGPVSGFANDLMKVRDRSTTNGLCSALGAVLDEVGVRVAAVGSGDGAAEREGNISELVGYAVTFSQDQEAAGVSGEGATVAFIEALSLAGSDQAGADGAPPPQVVISTVHAAKGKEFDWVLVAGCEEGVLPHSLSIEGGDVDEERRLMFVACSRPRATLVLSACESRLHFGRVVENEPSRFLDEVPAHLAVDEHAVSPRAAAAASLWASKVGKPRGKPEPSTFSRHVSTPKPPPVKRAPVAGRTFTVGATVTHEVFGPGKVSGVDASTVTVKFADGPSRTFVATSPTLTIT